MRRRWWAISLVAAVACAGAVATPVEIGMGTDACAHCRMTIVSRNTAAEIVAPGEEPRFFDEVGCLRDYLARATITPDAVIYVADHRTGAWVDARAAVFAHTAVSTPMASGLLAYADADSRHADPAARDGTPIDVSAILGAPRSSVP
jgi:copper chaperone NosL